MHQCVLSMSQIGRRRYDTHIHTHAQGPIDAACYWRALRICRPFFGYELQGHYNNNNNNNNLELVQLSQMLE